MELTRAERTHVNCLQDLEQKLNEIKDLVWGIWDQVNNEQINMIQSMIELDNIINDFDNILKLYIESPWAEEDFPNTLEHFKEMCRSFLTTTCAESEKWSLDHKVANKDFTITLNNRIIIFIG